MTRTALLASTAVWVLSAGIALADGAGGKIFTGLGDIGYMHNDYNPSGGSNFNSRTITGTGSALWSWPNNWNAQGNFGFNSERINATPDVAIDTWRVGAGGFWRDQNQGMVGGELNYKSIDLLGTFSGLNIAARGEYFLPQATLGGALGYTKFDSNGIKLSGWDLGAYGKYYVQPDLALSLGVNYSNWDSKSGLFGNINIDGWSGRGEAEYLIPDCATSVYAAVEYGSYDYGSSNLDYWSLGLGARFHFGTSGSLQNRQRTGPVEQFTISPRLTF